MKRILLLGVAALTLSVSTATAASFNFETTTIGTRSSLVLSNDGVTLTLTLTDNSQFEISDIGAFVPAFGTRSLDNFNACCTAAPYNGNFDIAQNFVQISFTDALNSDDDTPIILRIYSGANGVGLLDTVTTTFLPTDGNPNFKTLSVFSATPILSFQFTGSGANNNSMYWDNIVTRVDAVPEPMSLVLLSSGLLGLAARRRQQR